MSLPGKLFIGILEEDNPLKSFFRLKPLLVESEGQYVPYTQHKDYPNDGCIRIVPDKNESYHFKTRMRKLGLFCVVDLRAHPDDNDKIRPNKNFREDSPEQNAYIIYSDVVREPAPDTIFEILPEEARDGVLPPPRTVQVLLKGEALHSERYAWELLPGADDKAQLLPTDQTCPEGSLQVFDLETFKGNRIAFAIAPPPPFERPAARAVPAGHVVPVGYAAPAGRVAPAGQTAPAAHVAPAGQAVPAGHMAPAGQTSPAAHTAPAGQAAPAGHMAPAGQTAPAAHTAPAEQTAPAGHVVSAPAPVAQSASKPAPASEPAAAAAPAAPSVPAAPARPAPAPAAPRNAAPPAAALPRDAAPAPETPAAKPWIHHDSSMAPQPIDPRLSPAQRNLAAQSGLNPRRGRSLQELIDEKWQQSRLNQLGMPIAPIQTGAPVTSPVDTAVDAVRQVWQQPDLRQDLLSSLSGIEEFGASLEECRQAVRNSDIEQHLNSLEARRLALLGELDHLSLKHADVRNALKAELRRDADAELAEAVKKADAAKAEQAEYEKQAEAARAAAADARSAVDALTGETLEQYLSRFALTEHMLERMQVIRGEAEAVPAAAPALQNIDLNALAVRVMNRFDASGFAITRLQALNLCVCAALSPVLILSGPVGSGKTAAARMLAEALGWTSLGRFTTFGPARHIAPDDPRLAALRRQDAAPAMVLLDDANLHPAPDPLHGLDNGMSPGWRLVLTVQDGGMPLTAHTLDRGFTLRLDPKPATPWRPRPKAPCAPEAPARLSLTVPEAPLPPAMEGRMDALRTTLNRLGVPVSRRALDDAWRYCALMLWALGDNADPVAILDRAVAQRILPAVLASAAPDALFALPSILEGLPMSQALLTQPVPVAL